MRLRLVLIVAVGLMVSSPLAYAQNTMARLTGIVKDAQGGVLPGVTVTASSPALIAPQTVVTESNGTYNFPSLPEGTYTLSFKISGFQTYTRSDIALGVGQTLTVDSQMQVATVAEDVTVTASPVVDVKTTAVGNVLDTAKLIQVPSSSDLWGALAQAPGVMMQGFDVGGSHKSQQDSYVTFGIQNQNRVVTEGVDTTEGTGGSGFYQDFYAQNEIAVSGAGQDVSMNTPGAAVISTIKSGGNTFSSLINQTYEPSSFVGNNADAGDAARGGTANPNLLFWENHSDVGGPIVKNKAWFYGAYDHFHIDKQESGIPTNVATDLGVFNTYVTKETYKPSKADTLTGYWQWDKKQKPYRGLTVLTPPQSALAQVSPSWMYNGKWQRVWSNRLFTELNIGDFGYDFPERPSVPYTTNPPFHDLVTGIDSGAGWFNAAGSGGPFELDRDKPQVFATATYFLPTKRGSHDLTAGFEWRDDKEINARIGTSGPVLSETRGGVPAQVILADTGDPAQLGNTWKTPTDGNKAEALFIQDRWSPSQKVTITAGLRYDRQSPYYTTGTRAPILSSIFPSLTTQGQTLKTFNNVAPRIGVTVDPRGDGKTAVKAFYGRFYFNIAQTMAAVDPGGLNEKTYIWNDLNHNGIWDGPQENGNLIAASGGSSTTFNPNMPNAYTDELDLSVERQFWGQSSLRVGYIRKMPRKQYGAVNELWNGQFTNPYSTTLTLEQYNAANPSSPIVTGTLPITVFDIPNSLKGKVQNVIDTLPGNAAKANYDTFEIFLNKRFAKAAFISTGYDWTRSQQNNQASQDTSSLTQSDPLGVGFAFNPYPTVNLYQPTTQWSYVLQGRYEFPYGIGVAPNFRYQSGWAYAPIASIALPNAGTQSIFLQNLTLRSDNVPFLTVRVDKRVSLGGTRSLTGMLDVYNILNANPVDNFIITQNSRNFNEIIGMLDPRTLEVTLRFGF